jgi:hypothetical protein
VSYKYLKKKIIFIQTKQKNIWAGRRHPHLASFGGEEPPPQPDGGGSKVILGVVLATPKFLIFGFHLVQLIGHLCLRGFCLMVELEVCVLLFCCWKQGQATRLDEQLEEHPV